MSFRTHGRGPDCFQSSGTLGDMMKSTLNPGTALITGGSSGIGSVYADRLARRGYDLILAGRDPKRLEASATQLRATGRKVSTIASDLTRRADVKAIEQKLLSDPDISLLRGGAGAAGRAPRGGAGPGARGRGL